MNEPCATPPHPFLERHRNALILALFGILALSVVAEYQRARRDQRTITQLERMKAVYLRDTSRRDRPIIAVDLSATLVDDTGRVWPKSRVTDGDLARLRHLSWLESLSLRDNPITDAGLVNLANLRHLRFLDLAGTHVTNEGIARLRKTLPELSVRSAP